MAAVAALCLLAAAPATAAPAEPTRQVDRPLRATSGDGARVVDDLGRTVLLRGVNLNGLGAAASLLGLALLLGAGRRAVSRR